MNTASGSSKGQGVDQDQARAVEYWQKAADAGSMRQRWEP